MFACDHQYNVIFVDTKCPGACHDSRALKNSSLYHKYETNGALPFPGALIGGDGGYPDYLRWLVTPFPDGRDQGDPLEPRIRNFNKDYLRCRVLIECVIGQVKHCFYVLKRESPLKNTVMVAKLVQVCAALHNMCNEVGDDHEDLDENETGQIFIQPEHEQYEQEKDPEVSFGRPRVPNRRLLLEQYY